MKCPSCGKEVPLDRYKILGVKTCIECTPTVKPYLGVMNYKHKTGGVLIKTTDPKEFAKWKLPANRRR
jgi:hypothetical protein